MPEHTETAPLALPEAKDVRWWWVKGRTKGSSKAPSEDQFDRWLAARDRENRAIGWDEGVTAAHDRLVKRVDTEGLIDQHALIKRPRNPYRGDTQ